MKKHILYEKPKKGKMIAVVDLHFVDEGVYPPKISEEVSFDMWEKVLILGEVEIESYLDGMGYIVFSLETGDSLTMARSLFELIED